MKIVRQRMMLPILAVLVSVLVLLPAVAAFGQQVPFTVKTKELLQALRTGGLPTAAALVGHYVDGDDGDVPEMAKNLAELAQVSDAVVRATVVGEMPSTITGGLFIQTDYVVRVLERFQGPLASGTVATVRMRGGVVRFANNTIAEIRGYRVPKTRTGDEYVLFLTRFDDQPVFAPSLGPQGLFFLSTNGTVLSRGRRVDPIFQYDDLPRAQFIDLMRSSTSP